MARQDFLALARNGYGILLNMITDITAATNHLKPDNRNRGTLQEKTPPTMVPPQRKPRTRCFCSEGVCKPPISRRRGESKGTYHHGLEIATPSPKK